MNCKTRQLPFLGLTLSLVCFSLGCHRDPNVRKLKFLAEGDREYQQKKFAEAEIYYGRALQIDPRFAEAHYKLAQCFSKQKLWADAYQELLRTVDLRPDDWAAQLDLGNLLLRPARARRRRTHALLILHDKPDDTDAQILLSNADAFWGTERRLEEAQRPRGCLLNALMYFCISVFSKPVTAHTRRPSRI